MLGWSSIPGDFFGDFGDFPSGGIPWYPQLLKEYMVLSCPIHLLVSEFSGKPSSGGPRLQGLELECTMDDQDGQSKSKELHVGQ